MTICFYKGLTRNPEIGNTPVWILPNIWRSGKVRDTKFGPDVPNEMLLNAAKLQSYSSYRFRVIKGKPTGGVKLPPTQIRAKKKWVLRHNIVEHYIFSDRSVWTGFFLLGTLKVIIYYHSSIVSNDYIYLYPYIVQTLEADNVTCWNLSDILVEYIRSCSFLTLLKNFIFLLKYCLLWYCLYEKRHEKMTRDDTRNGKHTIISL